MMRSCATRMSIVKRLFVACWAAMAIAASAAHAIELPTADGFHGIWYSNEPQGDQYKYKYSGGLGTYPQQTAPLVIYNQDANRTYFVYGGTNGTANLLRNYISYYDHDTGLLARPREVRDIVNTNNVHRNATLSIDDDGYLWVFGNSHGNNGSGNLYRSTNPYEISAFDELPLPTSVFGNNSGDVKLAYGNALHLPETGHAVVYNQYDDGRAVHIATSPDGLDWTNQKLFDANSGHYTVAREHNGTIGITADFHRSGDLDNRTNLYYFQSSDFGQTWTNAAGTPLSMPLSSRINGALVHDYFAENRLVYMKDIDYDADGNPILLYLTVSDSTGNGHRSGPQPGGRTLHTAHWTGSGWQIRNVMQTDHNYDHGELYVEADGSWRLIGPFIDGPQVYGTGGEIGMWISHDQGATWALENQLTTDSSFNHTFVRIAHNAHDDFFAYWADGNAFGLSESRLYFADKAGNVYQMPTSFSGDFAAPILVHAVPEPAALGMALASALMLARCFRRRAA